MSNLIMGKVYLNEYRQKLSKKFRSNDLSKVKTPINIQELQNKKNRRFYTSLSDYLTNTEIRKSIKKVDNNTIKFIGPPQVNSSGTSSAFSISLSLTQMTEDGKELWECVLFEMDDYEEYEKTSEQFDNNKVAIEYFMNQIINLYN